MNNVFVFFFSLIPYKQSLWTSIAWHPFGQSFAQGNVSDDIAKKNGQQIPLFHAICLYFIIPGNERKTEIRWLMIIYRLHNYIWDSFIDWLCGRGGAAPNHSGQNRFVIYIMMLLNRKTALSNKCGFYVILFVVQFRIINLWQRLSVSASATRKCRFKLKRIQFLACVTEMKTSPYFIDAKS